MYTIFLVISAAFFLLLTLIFTLDPEETGGEGEYILPGDSAIEGLYPLFIVPTLLICGFIALFFTNKIFLRFYVNTLGRNRKIGLVPFKQLDNSALARKIFLRSLVLIFFRLNICYTIASQENIVEIMRSVDPPATFNVPDAALMYELAWILAIPCTFILIPIWAMNDIGLVSSKKNKELDFENADLASSTFYKIIKGYAGIGFMYSMVVMIVNWALETQEVQYVFLQYLSPIIFISFGFPLVIFLETQRENLRKRMWKTLQKHQMDKKFENNINLVAIQSLEEIK